MDSPRENNKSVLTKKRPIRQLHLKCSGCVGMRMQG